MSKCAQSADCGFGQVSFLILGCTSQDDYEGDDGHGDDDGDGDCNYDDYGGFAGFDNDDNDDQPEKNLPAHLMMRL